MLPLACRFFETFSYLPPLTDEQISKQVDYIINQGLIPCLEFSAAESAYVKDVANIRFVGSNAGYYDNRCGSHPLVFQSACRQIERKRRPLRNGYCLVGTSCCMHDTILSHQNDTKRVEGCRPLRLAALRHLGDRLAGVSPYRLVLVACSAPAKFCSCLLLLTFTNIIWAFYACSFGFWALANA